MATKYKANYRKLSLTPCSTLSRDTQRQASSQGKGWWPQQNLQGLGWRVGACGFLKRQEFTEASRRLGQLPNAPQFTAQGCFHW